MPKRKNNTLIILDGDNLCYRAYYKFNTLSGGGKPSGLVYGVSTMVKKLITQFDYPQVLGVFDSGRSKFRTDLLSEYKKRDKSLDFDQESFSEQKGDAIKLLKALGIGILKRDGYEADDLIYAASLLLRRFFDRIIIVSSDKDFNQTISEKISVWNPSKEVLLTPKNLKRRFGVEPFQVVDYLTLLGDSSDKIPGYRGMGEKRIADFFTRFSSIAEYLKSKEVIKILDKEKLEAVRILNKKLISLRYFYFKVTIHDKAVREVILHSKGRKVNHWGALSIAQKYNIRTITKEFITFFNY